MHYCSPQEPWESSSSLTPTRISAVGTAGGIGIILVIAGTVFLAPGLSNAVKAIIIVALQLGTSAIGSIAIARSAYLTGVPCTNNTSTISTNASD